jgi:hypothetical protein
MAERAMALTAPGGPVTAEAFVIASQPAPDLRPFTILGLIS